MAYFREAHYPKKLLVGFTEDQRAALDKCLRETSLHWRALCAMQ